MTRVAGPVGPMGRENGAQDLRPEADALGERLTTRCGLKGRETVDPAFEGRGCEAGRSRLSRPFRPQEWGALFPVCRPPASALGWVLPARWAGGKDCESHSTGSLRGRKSRTRTSGTTRTPRTRKIRYGILLLSLMSLLSLLSLLLGFWRPGSRASSARNPPTSPSKPAAPCAAPAPFPGKADPKGEPAPSPARRPGG
jgi:hypothetical protein